MADYASGISALAAAGAKVIADDFGYYDEPFFQDGLLAQAVDAVEAQGVAYFSAAGNDQMTPAYQNTAPSFSTLQSSGANAGEYLLNFDTTGATTATALPVTIPALAPGGFVAVVLEWDQPYVTGSPKSPGASSQLDVCIAGGTGSDVILNYDNDVASCSGPNAVGADPYQIMIIANPANAAGDTQPQNLTIAVGLAHGTTPPGRILLAVEDDGLGSTITQFANDGPTLQGHPGAAGAAAVGAAFYFDTPRCGTTPAALEAYSSAGGAPILFDTSGARLATPVIRNKPDFVGPDGVNDTFLGFTLASDSPPFPANGLLATSISECQNNPHYPNFFGTSAATPHAASIAALMLQANAAATPTEIYEALRNSALPMSATTPNFNSGYGFIQADAALARDPSHRSHTHAGSSFHRRREFDHDQLVVRQRRELHGVGKLERNPGEQRLADAHAIGGRNGYLFADLLEYRRYFGARRGDVDGDSRPGERRWRRRRRARRRRAMGPRGAVRGATAPRCVASGAGCYRIARRDGRELPWQDASTTPCAAAP